MSNEIADKLVDRTRKAVHPDVRKLRDFVEGRPSAKKLMAEVKDADTLVAKGYDPLHAAYTSAQNYLSVFCELLAQLRAFRRYNDLVADAQDDYNPSWPTISPVSQSFFTSWAFLDVPIGATDETVATCAATVGRAFGMPESFAATLGVMGSSRIGIYEHLGWQDNLVGLRDILDGKEYHCIVPSGHRGKEGELWLTRILPPLDEATHYSNVFTSPYILCDTKPMDWLDFFARQEAYAGKSLMADDEKILARQALLKRGPTPNYWNEYVFLGYSGHTDHAISLFGIPDILESLPHGRMSRYSPGNSKSRLDSW